MVESEMCPRCGKELPHAKPTGRPRRWCSDRCRWARERILDTSTGLVRLATPDEVEARRERREARMMEILQELGEPFLSCYRSS